MSLSRARIAGFRRTVYGHYRAHGRRALPWRATKDPYRILVSEFMLQQTQVARVAGKYESFLRRFPDFDTLARSALRDVLEEWSGLGYNRRALQLRETARLVVSRFKGKLPRDARALRALPGVGPSTAAGILNFAFNEPHAFIETNIRAAFIREFFTGRKKIADAEILPLVEETMDAKNPRRWFYALMDFGVGLKRSGPNPSRRSAHHARQSRFEGSVRQARGLIIKTLAAGPRDVRELARETGLDAGRIQSVLPALSRDGLIVRRGKKLHIGA